MGRQCDVTDYLPKVARAGARGDPDGGATFPTGGLSFICRVKLPILH